MARETFAQARARLLGEFKALGWDVRTYGQQGALKSPHATSPDGRTRVWFRPQALYYAQGTHDAGSAHSLTSDIRGESASRLAGRI